LIFTKQVLFVLVVTTSGCVNPETSGTLGAELTKQQGKNLVEKARLKGASHITHR